jgi:phage shock protein A
MLRMLRRWFKYFTAKGDLAMKEKADPRVQLEQATVEMQDQHRRLVEQAANVVANQKQTELKLNRALEELGKVNGSARQALLMADEAARNGDAAKATEFSHAAESFANRLIQIEHEVESLKQLLLQAAEASNQAKAAVAQNATNLQKKLAERQRLLSQLDQAKMQEQVNKAMASLSETVGEDVPTVDEVRDKIEARYAKALGQSEVQNQSVSNRMLEVEHELMNTEAQGRLAQLRSQLGLSSTPGEAAPAPPAEGDQPAG